MTSTTETQQSRSSPPQFVMGGDGFLPFCSRESRPEHMTSEEYAYSVLDQAYRLGIRAFDFSWHMPLLRAISKLRARREQITVFANINWRCGINLKGTDLIDLKTRFLRTIYERYLSGQEREYVHSLPPDVQAFWFGFGEQAQCVTAHEIDLISMDIGKYEERLGVVSKIADFCLIGTDIVDWLVVMDRTDILEQMIQCVLSHGLRPVSITHWTSKTIPVLRRFPFSAYWCLLNPVTVFFSEDKVRGTLAGLSSPVFAFSALRGQPQLSIQEKIRRALSYPQVEGIVVGLKTETEVIETVGIAGEFLSVRSCY